MGKVLIIVISLIVMCSYVFANDILIDEDGDIITGTSNSSGNLKVKGGSGEHGVVGESSGTGGAGVFGKNTDVNNYGLLGNDSYGVYGNSSSGYAGYFEGDARVTGNLTIDGNIEGENDPTVNASVKDGVDWSELTGIPAGFADGIDNTGGSGMWTQSGSDIYFNSGRVGIGTSTPSGMLDVIGDMCLGGICRTTWPSGSGSGAFTDTGSAAYYNGGSVGIGTSSPVSLGSTDTRALHLMQPVSSLDNSAAGVRLEVEDKVIGGITSAYNKVTLDGGIFIGTLSNHRIGFVTNSMGKMSLTPNGNLGIGTTSPHQLLHVQENAYVSDNLGIGIDSPSNKLQVSGTNALFSSDTGDFRVSISKKLDTGISSVIFADNFSGRAELGLMYDDNFHIKVSPDGATFTDALIVDRTNGNVAVGTSDTSYKMHVIGGENNAVWAESTSNLPTLNVVQYGTGYGMRIIQGPDGTQAALYIVQRASAPALLVRNNSAEIMRLDSTGNLGIGTDTPQSKLQVNGYIQLALTSGEPPITDCDETSERGRMKVDDTAGLLYICASSGWISK